MTRLTFVIVLLVVTNSLVSVRHAVALGGRLDTPGISIPLDGPNGSANPVATQLNQTLVKHQDLFADGSFVNSSSRLGFAGKTESLNEVLHELAEIEGAELVIRFSDHSRKIQPAPGISEPKESFDWLISHNGEISPGQLTVEIMIQKDRIQFEQLELPAIRDRRQELPAAALKSTLKETK